MSQTDPNVLRAQVELLVLENAVVVPRKQAAITGCILEFTLTNQMLNDCLEQKKGPGRH